MTSADDRSGALQSRHAAAAGINSAQRSFGDLQVVCGTIWWRSSRPAQNQKEEMRMSKDGLCAIVTGSASGLGAASAAILAKDGARIVINYSSSQKEAEQTADLCRAAGGDGRVGAGEVSGA